MRGCGLLRKILYISRVCTWFPKINEADEKLDVVRLASRAANEPLLRSQQKSLLLIESAYKQIHISLTLIRLVSIDSCMTFASATQFHFYLLWVEPPRLA